MNIRYAALLACGSMVLPLSVAHATELRFSQTAAGNVIATGNTLGLSKDEGDLNSPGVDDSIGTFITLTPNSVDDTPATVGTPYPMGTTGDWTENGSEAELTLPADIELLYAELVWGGSYNYIDNVTANLDDDIEFQFGNDTITVSPDPTTAETVSEPSGTGNFDINYYMRSAEVTQFVAQHGSGTYAALGIPAVANDFVSDLNAAGWTLIVAYRNSEDPVRNLTVFVGGSFVDENTVEDYTFDGFCTPPQGPFEAFAAVSAIEGDASRDGDSLAIAPTAMDTFVTLSGPNNPADNFFCSQLNDGDGMLDTSGSFGDVNHNAATATNVSGARQGWDITRIPLSSGMNQLSNGQTSAVLRTQTTDDSYYPTTAGFAIGVNAPDFTGDGTNRDYAPDALELDQTSTITINMENDGLVDATDLLFFAPLPEGLTLDSFAIDGNDGDIMGSPVDAAALETGVNIGDVAVGTAREIEFVVRSSGAPADGDDTWVISPTWNYDYISCVGEDALTEPFLVSDVVIDYVEPMGTSGSEGTTTGDDSTSDSDSDTDVEPTTASATITATTGDTGDTDSDSAGDTAGGALDDDGCGCRADGRRAPVGAALLLLGLFVGRRRRR